MALPDEAVFEAVSRYLDRHWDPIGLSIYEEDERPPPGSEYRGYAEHIVRMLRRGKTLSSISHYLNRVATRTMKVGPSGKERVVAARLHEWHASGSDPAALDA
jgi:hypothetical protein